MLSLLFLPLRLACGLVFGLLSIPFLLVRALFRLLGALILLPLVLVLTVIGAVVGGFMLLVPLVFLGAFVWMLVWLFGPPVSSAIARRLG